MKEAKKKINASVILKKDAITSEMKIESLSKVSIRSPSVIPIVGKMSRRSKRV